MDFPKKQQQCLIPRYLLQYLQDLQISHNDPTAPWGGGGGGSYTAGTGIDITDDTISVDSSVVALKSDLSNYITTSELTTELSNYVTSTDLETELLDYAELSDLATVATSGDYNDLLNKPNLSTVATTGSYNDLLNKPTIPDAVSGTYSGSNWTSLTIGSTTKNIPSGGSTPTNMVTTNTAQDITAVKTFIGSKMIAFKEAADGNYLGFTAYNTEGNEFGNLQCGSRSIKLYTGSTTTSESKKLVTLGNYSNNNSLQPNCYAGFRVKDLSGYQRNFVAPKSDFSTYYDVGSADTYYIPMGITDGNTTCLAPSSGIINISPLVPTTATSTSTSTFTPTTETLTFTYSDNTTATITIVTSATVSTTTNTTLS